MKCNVFMREEGVRRFLHRYNEFVKSLVGYALRSNHEICGAFRVHFCDRLARFPDLSVQEFRSCLANFPCFGEAEAVSCEGLVTECEIRNTLKQIGLNKSPGLDGLPSEVYLRMSHMFVPIQRDVQPLVCSGSHSW